MNTKYKIVHLTSVHTRYDTRIFIKMCSSLAHQSYDVSLVVADGKGNEIKNLVHIYDIGKLNGRINRILKTTQNVYKKALELNADLYHIHDPELIPIGLKLKKKGKKVIFDAHEDLPKQLLSKPYLKNYQQKTLSWIAQKYEQWACSKFDAIVTATPFIRDKFLNINANSIDINNFPILGELTNNNVTWDRKQNGIAYVGGITKIRGILQVINSLSYTQKDIKLELVGEFSEVSTQKIAIDTHGWSKVNQLGFLNRSDVSAILDYAIAGIVTFLPAPNHIDAQPNKMFEYMSVGLPVIASNFPLWKEIIEGNSCGICVDPLDPQAIATAIDYIVNNPNEAEIMGNNGKKAVEEKFNWRIEEIKLFNLYSGLLNRNKF